MKIVSSLRRRSRLMMATALLCGGAALAAPSQVSVTIIADGTNTITNNSYDPITGSNPGQDSSTTNNIVRTNDTISYGFQFSLEPGTTKNTIVSVLPKVNGQIYETWQNYPSGCDTTLSSLSADKLTFTCVYTASSSTGTQSINLTGVSIVSGNVPNGTVLPAPTTTIYSTEYPTPLPSVIDPIKNTSVTVTAKPRYDLSKTVPNYTPNPSGVSEIGGNTYMTKNVPGPDGVTPGTLIMYPLVLSANYGSEVSQANLANLKAADEIKGLSPLVQPITITDTLNIPGAVIYNQNGNWVNAMAGTSGGCAPAGGNTRVTGLNPVTNSTCTVSSNTSSGVATTANPTVATISISNMTINAKDDNGSSRFIPTPNASGAIIDARLELTDRVLLVWVPNYYPYQSTSTNGTSTDGIYKNTYTNFNPVTADGQTNVQGNTINDSDYVNLSNPTPNVSGGSAKSFSTDLSYSIDRKTGNNRGSVSTGTPITSTVNISNSSTGNGDWYNINICDKIDNTTFNVNPINGVVVTGIGATDSPYTSATLTTNMANITTPYKLGGSTSEDIANGKVYSSTKYYIVQYTNTGVNGAIGWGPRDSNNHSAAQATATCGDDQGPWYTDIASAGGASAVTKIRVLTNYPLYTMADSYYGVSTINATFNLIVVGTPTQPTLMDNWGTTSSSTFTATRNPFGTIASGAAIADANGAIWSSFNAANNVTTPYISAMGDEAWLIPAKASIKKTIPKAISNGATISPADSQTVNGGAVATFQLSPSLTLANATTTNTYPVTIIDTLPKYFTYVAGSASVTPDSIVSNSDGTTTITWTLPNITPTSTGTITPITFQATVDAATPDSSTLTNNAYISTPADPPSTVAAVRALPSSIYASSTYVKVTNTTGIYPVKTVLTPYVAAKGIAQYQLSWYSMGSGAASNPQIIDVLPYVGDGRGTTNTPVGLASAPTPANNDSSMVFYYTAATPSTIKQDPNDASNALTTGAAVSSGSTVWCLQSSFGTTGCPANLNTVTGIRGVSTNPMSAGTQYSTTINVNTSQTPVDGDIYTNSLSIRANGLQFLATSNNVKAVVRIFSLSGTVIKDTNSNGIQDTGEVGLSGATLTLTGTDSNGQAVSMITSTDGNGKYNFKDLPAGTYTVTEAQPAGYATTINTVGSFNNTTDGTLATPTTDAITTIVLNGNVNATAATGYNFGEIQNFVKPPLHKWVDNCGTKADLTGCPAVNDMTSADSANSEAHPGDILRYTLILDNRANGIPVANTVISDNVPAHTTFLGATANMVPAVTGSPLLSTQTASPYTWVACTGASSTASTCSADGATHINVGWNSNGDTTINNSDLVPASSQLRVTFWVKVN